jgi:hypothetical protein
METPQKTRIAYTDENGMNRVISILPEQMPFYIKYQKTKEEIENGRWKGENREKAYECLEKCIAGFTYQKSKDEPMECECGAIINRCVIARHRATAKHLKQMEALKQDENPKEPIQLADTDKICECGQVVSKANYARHLIGNRHAKYMQNR